jgi:hypothetical protein
MRSTGIIWFVFYFWKNREDYFLRIPAATSSVKPIAARIVTIPTGEFCVIAAVAVAAGTAVPEAGACVCVFIAPDAVPPTGWIQWYCTIASALCPQTVLLHISYPFTPHCAMAELSAMHAQGAVQTGALTPDVSWVSAMIPTPSALTPPHMNATIPRITIILT